MAGWLARAGLAGPPKRQNLHPSYWSAALHDRPSYYVVFHSSFKKLDYYIPSVPIQFIHQRWSPRLASFYSNLLPTTATKMTKTQSNAQGGNNRHPSAYSRTTGHHQSKGPHKGKKTVGKRRLNYGGGGDGAGGTSGGHNFGNRTTKENAFKAGYRKTGKAAAAPKPFMMDGEVVPKLDQK